MYIVVGLVFGLVWAGVMWGREAVTDPAELIGPVLLCGIFGGVLWGVRVLVLRFRAGPKP